MATVKVVHIGGIDSPESTLQEFIAESRVAVMYKINVWLLDYCKKVKDPIVQLPPLDDWTRSREDLSKWTYDIPEMEFGAWIKEGKAMLPK